MRNPPATLITAESEPVTASPAALEPLGEAAAVGGAGVCATEPAGEPRTIDGHGTQCPFSRHGVLPCSQLIGLKHAPVEENDGLPPLLGLVRLDEVTGELLDAVDDGDTDFVAGTLDAEALDVSDTGLVEPCEMLTEVEDWLGELDHDGTAFEGVVVQPMTAARINGAAAAPTAARRRFMPTPP
jgi:hypothetical protein